MDKIVLKATKRTMIGKQVKQLRRDGKLPAVIYGHNVEPISISLDAHEAGLMLPRVTSSTLITIDVEGKEYATLVREKQRNYIKNALLHVDFLAVSLTEKIRATVGIELIGTAPAVKDFSAVIVANMTEVEVECLPTELPEKFTVDISSLKEIGDNILVSALKVSDKLEILADPETALVVAASTQAEAEEETEEEVSEEGAEPELSVERGKKDEDED